MFVNDTFTDTAGTDLSAHTPDTGGAYTSHASYGGELVISDANRLRRGAAGSNALYYNATDPATAEYDVQVDLHVVTTSETRLFGPAGRIATGANTLYFARYSVANSRWELFRIVAGSAVAMGTFSQTLTAGNSYTCKLELRNAAKKVFIDAVERISDTDNTITAAGKIGVREGVSGAGSGGSNTTGHHLDNLVATDAGGGGAAVPTLALLGVGT